MEFDDDDTAHDPGERERELFASSAKGPWHPVEIPVELAARG